MSRISVVKGFAEPDSTGQTTVNRSVYRNWSKNSEKCCMYLDIFSCVKINVFRFETRDACQMR